MLNRLRKSKVVSSMEAIQHQSDFRFRELVTIITEAQMKVMDLVGEDKFENFIDRLQLLEIANNSGLSDYIYKAFNIKNNIVYTQYDGPNACVLTSLVNQKSSLLDINRQFFLKNDEFVEKFDRSVNNLQKMVGGVDRKTAKLIGVSSELTHEMEYDVWWFHSDNCSAEQFASVILHEVGHVFTCCELAIGETFKNELMNSYRQLNDPNQKERFEYLVIPEKYRDDPKIKDIIEKSDDSMDVMIQTGLDEIVRNEIGNQPYAERGWEQLADEFSVKLGAGKYLFEFNYAMDKKYGEIELKKTPQFLVNQICTLSLVGSMIAVSALSPVTAILTATVLIVRFSLGHHKTHKSEYDNPGKRLLRIRQETVARIRSKVIRKEEKKELIEQLKMMDEVIKQYRDRTTFFDVITSFGGIRGAGLRNSHKQQALLEKLAQNELHVLKAKLDNFGE